MTNSFYFFSRLNQYNFEFCHYKNFHFEKSLGALRCVSTKDLFINLRKMKKSQASLFKLFYGGFQIFSKIRDSYLR